MAETANDPSDASAARAARSPPRSPSVPGAGAPPSSRSWSPATRRSRRRPTSCGPWSPAAPTRSNSASPSATRSPTARPSSAPRTARLPRAPRSAPCSASSNVTARNSASRSSSSRTATRFTPGAPKRSPPRAADSGVDGVLCVDLPPDEGLRELQPALEKRGVDSIYLIAATSTRERIDRAAAASSGFVYYTARSDVTGEREDLIPTLAGEVRRVRRRVRLPVAVGFGISTPGRSRRWRRSPTASSSAAPSSGWSRRTRPSPTWRPDSNGASAS